MVSFTSEFDGSIKATAMAGKKANNSSERGLNMHPVGEGA